MYDFTLTEEQEALRTMVREFVERVVKPKAAVLESLLEDLHTAAA